MRVREPLLYPLAAACVGVTAGHFIPFTVREVLPAAVACALVAAVCLRRLTMASFCAAMSAVALGFIAISAWHPVPTAPQLSVDSGEMAIFGGCVTGPSLSSGQREKFLLEMSPGVNAQIALYSKAGAELQQMRYGTRVEFTGKVRAIRNYNNPGSFDAVRYFARQRVFWNGSADAATLRVLPGECGSAFERPVFALRAAALRRLEVLYPDDAYTGAMMEALLLGETSRMEKLWTEDYRSTGTYHALVISGSHVAVLAAVLLFLLRILWCPPSATLVATVAAAWLYAGVTGWQSPVVRSAAGMTLYGVARIFYREGRLLNLLAGVALVFLVMDPSQLFDPSFQLSFLAVAAIGAFGVPVLDATSGPLAAGCGDLGDLRRDLRLPPKTAQFRVEMRLLAVTLGMVTRLPRRAAEFAVVAVARVAIYIYEVALMSVLIQISLALPSIWYFHRLSLSGVLANVMVLPALTALVPLGFLAIAFTSHQVASFCALLLSLSRWAAGFNAGWEPDWRIPAPPLWLALLLGGALLLAAWRALGGWWRAGVWVAVVLVLAAIAVYPFRTDLQRGRFELTVIDVGQGDSLLAAFPRGKLMLIDAGGIATFGRASKTPGIDIGEDVVSPYLWSKAVRRLDVVVMTHAHEDHMGGMPAVLRNFRPAELWVGAVPESGEWTRVRAAAQRYGVKIREMRRGAAFGFDETSVAVLAPSPDYQPGPKPKNDDSLVLRIQFGQTAFLLAGDMEKRTEMELASGEVPVGAMVLKVGHHGSRTSSTPEFLDLVHPAFAMISDGFENSYGHPHANTLAALNERHVEVLRTDERGAVTVSSDGHRIRVE